MSVRRIAGFVLGGLALLLGGFLLVGLLLPGRWSAEREAVIQAPPATVFLLLDDLRAWDRWTAWSDVSSTFEGPERGTGARRIWDDPNLGDGSMEIVGSRAPERLDYQVLVEGGSLRFEGTLELRPEGDGTRIRWTESGDFGGNPLLGWVARTMDETQGRQLEMNLERLREVVEAMAGDTTTGPPSAQEGGPESLDPA